MSTLTSVHRGTCVQIVVLCPVNIFTSDTGYSSSPAATKAEKMKARLITRMSQPNYIEVFVVVVVVVNIAVVVIVVVVVVVVVVFCCCSPACCY